MIRTCSPPTGTSDGPDVSRHRPACSTADGDGGGGLAVNPPQLSGFLESKKKTKPSGVY